MISGSTIRNSDVKDYPFSWHELDLLIFTSKMFGYIEGCDLNNVDPKKEDIVAGSIITKLTIKRFPPEGATATREQKKCSKVRALEDIETIHNFIEHYPTLRNSIFLSSEAQKIMKDALEVATVAIKKMSF